MNLGLFAILSALLFPVSATCGNHFNRHWEVLGYESEELRSELGDEKAQKVMEIGMQGEEMPTGNPGGDRRSQDFQNKQLNLKQGPTALYLARRIARKAQTDSKAQNILERMKKGEFMKGLRIAPEPLGEDGAGLERIGTSARFDVPPNTKAPAFLSTEKELES